MERQPVPTWESSKLAIFPHSANSRVQRWWADCQRPHSLFLKNKVSFGDTITTTHSQHPPRGLSSANGRQAGRARGTPRGALQGMDKVFLSASCSFLEPRQLSWPRAEDRAAVGEEEIGGGSCSNQLRAVNV